MGKLTSISIDEELHEEAKLLGISFKDTLEEGLRQKLNKDTIIQELKEKRKKCLQEARKYKKKIDELEKIKEDEDLDPGVFAQKMKKALKICSDVDRNEAGITDERIRAIGTQQGVPILELINKYRLKKVSKKE